MTDEARCPKCGAEPQERSRQLFGDWVCGSRNRHPVYCQFHQADDCRIRQLEQQLARVMEERDECLMLLRNMRGWDISIADRKRISEFLDGRMQRDTIALLDEAVDLLREWQAGCVLGTGTLPVNTQSFLARLDKEPE